MPFLASLTRPQRAIVLVLLALNVAWVYGAAVLLAVARLQPGPIVAVASPTLLPVARASSTKPSPPPPSTRTPAPVYTRASAMLPAKTPGATRTAALSPTRGPSTNLAQTRRQVAARAVLAPSSLAELELEPRVRLTSKTSFFTSACFGRDANPLQDRDNMAPADWAGAPNRKCIFGYHTNLGDELPTGRYSVFGGPDGQPHFYIIPPEAFAQDQENLKQLSQLHLIVAREQGCGELGSIGITADGQTYQCSACAFLKAGGVCPAGDGSKALVLPANGNNTLNPEATGGAYGFVSFPAVLFRRGFSLYFTGKDGFPPPHTYFESTVDTLLPNFHAKTTAEMTGPEIMAVASQFDQALSGVDPLRRLAPLEQEAALTSSPTLVLRPKERGTLSFAARPGSLLSSISWTIRPETNQSNPAFLETNLCLGLNGQVSCFTGVEDFAHCAFFTPCRTGYSSLVPIASGAYVATRYFPAGAAPVTNDGKISTSFQAPDIGTVLEIEVKVRVRNPSAVLAKQQ